MGMSGVDPRRYLVDDDTEFVDVDLDDEEVEYEGDRLTEAQAEALAEQALAEARRRKVRPEGRVLVGWFAESRL